MMCKLPKNSCIEMFESAVPLVKCFRETQLLVFFVGYVYFCVCILFPNPQLMGCVVCVVLICFVLLCFIRFCIVFLETHLLGQWTDPLVSKEEVTPW